MFSKCRLENDDGVQSIDTNISVLKPNKPHDCPPG